MHFMKQKENEEMDIQKLRSIAGICVQFHTSVKEMTETYLNEQ